MTDFNAPAPAVFDMRVPGPGRGLPGDFFLWVRRDGRSLLTWARPRACPPDLIAEPHGWRFFA